MQKLCAALLIYLGLLGAAQAQGIGAQPIICNKVAVSAQLSAGTAQLIPGNPGQLIDVCGFDIQGLTAGTIQLVAGTGAGCTTPTNITGNFVTGTATPMITDHIPTAFFSSALGQSLCAVVTGTSAVIVDVYYAQP